MTISTFECYVHLNDPVPSVLRCIYLELTDLPSAIKLQIPSENFVSGIRCVIQDDVFLKMYISYTLITQDATC